ncbi:MAG: class I SAM-dependent methyltransferase [Cyclobacteriaceae bacterium]|nr:class I SAM-dependent methyltransferase [Cyclobacteriaceae bacterium]MCB0498457.1 class I SAM-dependent methyltransferase [Cyclobacteriaceae bacterium]MCB9236974.1 class I SAM-dependent methyltransferase [Flammeovirgaceae bacterium]MCW5901317.1 class I SAM-dependent methyltransferase [Cyclobacteriaceae bacterium]
MQMQYPDGWEAYELIDSGNFEKLERFGDYVLARPEPQAIWAPSLTAAEWGQRADAHFHREQKSNYRFGEEAKGGWKKKNNKMPDSWRVVYHHQRLKLTLRLALTGFGHVGVFPEQANNWDFIFETIGTWGGGPTRVLNLFAYTGAASVVARMAGAGVVHVDSSRPGLNWASQNMELNRQTDIRWVYEDALKFVKREVKRGNRYNGIIMDPPPYGRGPGGEKWMLQDKLNELVALSSALLLPKKRFFVLSMYAVGLSAQVGLNVVQSHFQVENPQYGEFHLRSSNQRNLPMGTFLRFRG